MPDSPRIRVGIVGGAGYTGGELLRILLNHPHTNLVFVHSKSNAGNPVHKVHHDLLGDTDLTFSSELSAEIDVLFLCVGHGDARKFLAATPIPDHVRVIDLSQDFRLNSDSSSGNRDFVYGLPELQREKIREARNVANPGCFATALQLGLLPLASEGLLGEEVHSSGITGSTGAGQSLTETSHFSWRNNNLSSYKVMSHQHLHEIRQSLRQLQPDFSGQIPFVPYRGNFTRGILITSYLRTDISSIRATALYKEYFASHPFVHLSDTNPHLKQVVNTNKCLLYLEKHEDTLVITSMIDNLLKGASGQAVQNMNLLFGLDEQAGLRLKASYF
jgi:N-acetyl-gamma-glutamyl-phosphate reductase